jgi:uncharacterized membrane-anchored protein YitT (DUF2179 family)
MPAAGPLDGDHGRWVLEAVIESALRSLKGSILPMADGGLPSAQARRDTPAHSLIEDGQALLTAALFVAFGVAMLKHTGLLTGGAAGAAFLVHYATGWNFGVVFFLVNAPFYALAAGQMGGAFVIKTLAAATTMSVASELMPLVVSFDRLDPAFAAIMGGFMIGMGLLILFRHGASLGGTNILALYLQDKHGLRAGWVQLAVDALILAASFWIVSPRLIALSILGAVALNLVIAVNHRPGRYMGV